MTQYSTDFSEYSTGSPPSDWTSRWDTTTGDFDIVTYSGGIGGRELLGDYQASRRKALSWDDVSSTADVKLLAKVRAHQFALNQEFQAGLVVRGSGTSTTETGYFVVVYPGGNSLRLHRIDNGTVYAAIATASKTIDHNSYYWLRFEVSSSPTNATLKARIWEEGTNEPGTWDIDSTDTNITGSGWTGVYFDEGGTNLDSHWDYFAVGTSGDDPPNPNLVVADSDHLHAADNIDLVVSQNFTTDFSEYTTSSAPSDWTQRWDSSDDWTVETGSGIGSKQLQADPGASEYQSAISWDDIGSVSDVKVLAKLQSPSAGGGTYAPAIVVRGAGSAGSEDGYAMRLNDTLNRLEVLEYNSGSGATGAYHSHTMSQGNWYWIRFEISGTTLRARIWDDGNTEHGTWDINTTDTSLAGPGWVGVYTDQNDGWCDYFSAATGSAEPVNPPIDLTVAAVDHLHDADNLDLQTGLTLSVQAADHQHAADAPALTQDHSLAVDGADHLHVADSIVLTAQHLLTVAECYHIHAPPNLTLTRTFNLSLEEAAHVHDADTPSLTEVHSLAPADGDHLHIADSLALTQAHTLSVAAADHANWSSVIAVTQRHVLGLSAAFHLFVGDNVRLGTGLHGLAANHDVVSSQVRISTEQDLTVAEAAHDLVDDAPGLVVTLGVQPAEHLHFCPLIDLTGTQYLAGLDADHVMASDTFWIVQIGSIEVQGADHDQVAENPILNQQNQLSVTEIVHLHSADALAVSQEHYLYLDAGHGHSHHTHVADNIEFAALPEILGQSVLVSLSIERSYRRQTTRYSLKSLNLERLLSA